ncbi:MAG: hypothetical protein WBC63_07205 [Candidatus Bipolaricaulia bacterium]
MKKRGRWILGVVGVVVVAVVVIVLWPASDPLAGVETVAVRVGESPSSAGAVNFEGELQVVLGERDIRIVTDEASADAVLELTDFTINLGDVEISLTEGGLRGRANAICTLRDVRNGKTHVMDFYVRFDRDGVRADLVPRKFWQIWKRSPSE